MSSNLNQQWPTGVPRADVDALCKQLDYTFVDIPDLVYSEDEQEVEMTDGERVERERERVRNTHRECATPTSAALRAERSGPP
jgi:hypothetical protein